MMHYALRSRKGEMHHDYGYPTGMGTPADRLKDARIKAGYATAKSAAEGMGVTVSTYIQHESGARGFPASRAARYAKFFRVAPEWLLYGRGSSEPAPVEPTLTELPLIGPVQAGAWLAVDETAQDEPLMVAVARDRRYPHARQWLREVRGDSMSARNIYPGDLAHVVDLTEAGINLNTGMIVEVTRTRDGGGLREITLKEVEIGDSAVILWPRSLNPRWKDPMTLGSDDGSDIEVQITGLLLAKITRF
jgi:SOS-response transcriptional repressor LexA